MSPWPWVDTHADSLGDVLAGRRHLDAASGSGQWDFVRMRAAGQRIAFLSCWVEPVHKPAGALARLLAYVDAAHAELERDPSLTLVRDGASLTAAWAEPAGGVVLSVEGAEALGTDPAILRILWRLGVRVLALTWNERNLLADGAGEDPGGGGLSRAGRRVVAEMNRLGMVVDVSHLAEAGFWDVLALSTRPPLASHSNCRALAPHPRNLSDAQIRALARAGGVQSVTFVKDFLGGTRDRAAVVGHILHHLDVVGDDRHVALGSDFDGVTEAVPGLEDPGRVPDLFEDLARAGLGEATLRRLAGENVVALLRAHWEAGS
ncbi:MAG: dipeptidase [Actinomycetia bacterium]|nr:dipeptidase [Actinomycetes bacterium]